jgi:hypothetical protein
MTPAEYRAKAALLLERAQGAEPSGNPELIAVALSYLRLADLAEKNASNDRVYETPTPGSDTAATQAQQQAQQAAKGEPSQEHDLANGMNRRSRLAAYQLWSARPATPESRFSGSRRSNTGRRKKTRIVRNRTVDDRLSQEGPTESASSCLSSWHGRSIRSRLRS